MAYRWKPSKAQRAEFARNMQNEEFANAYHQRKADKAAKQRESSKFDYSTAGGEYIPTKEQREAAFYASTELVLTAEEATACNMIMYGYDCRERIHHDFIHLVNQLRRKHKSQFTISTN